MNEEQRNAIKNQINAAINQPSELLAKAVNEQSGMQVSAKDADKVIEVMSSERGQAIIDEMLNMSPSMLLGLRKFCLDKAEEIKKANE